MCLKLLLRDVFERFIWCLDHWLSCILDCIHVYVFHFSKNCFYKLTWHLFDTLLSVELLKFFSYRNLDCFSTLGGSIEKVPRPSIASRQLVDRSSFCSCVFALFLDTFLTVSFVDVVFLDTSRHLYLSRITKDLYKGQARFGFHSSRSLSQQLCLFTSQTSLTHSKSSSQVIFEFFQVFSSLGMFLFSLLHGIRIKD